MKVGDLVTLSASGANLDMLARWSDMYRVGYQKKKSLVGMIIGIKEGKLYYERGKKIYEVRWFAPDGPVGRYGQHTRQPGFWRRDLKFISRA